MKYIVKVEERLVRHVAIEAKDEKEAEAKAERMYRAARIVLDAADYDGVTRVNSMGAVYQRPELAAIAREMDE